MFVADKIFSRRIVYVYTLPVSVVGFTTDNISWQLIYHQIVTWARVLQEGLCRSIRMQEVHRDLTWIRICMYNTFQPPLTIVPCWHIATVAVLIKKNTHKIDPKFGRKFGRNFGEYLASSLKYFPCPKKILVEKLHILCSPIFDTFLDKIIIFDNILKL